MTSCRNLVSVMFLPTTAKVQVSDTNARRASSVWNLSRSEFVKLPVKNLTVSLFCDWITWNQVGPTMLR